MADEQAERDKKPLALRAVSTVIEVDVDGPTLVSILADERVRKGLKSALRRAGGISDLRFEPPAFPWASGTIRFVLDAESDVRGHRARVLALLEEACEVARRKVGLRSARFTLRSVAPPLEGEGPGAEVAGFTGAAVAMIRRQYEFDRRSCTIHAHLRKTGLPPEAFMDLSDDAVADRAEHVHSKVPIVEAGDLSAQGRACAAMAAEYLADFTNVEVTPEQMAGLLTLYPAYWDDLVRSQTMDPSSLRHDLQEIYCHFFGGTRWPAGRDEIDMYAFTERLDGAARSMGYSVTKRGKDYF